MNEIENMSNEELTSLRNAVIAEITRRNDAAKEKAWKAVRNAIYDYVTAFGEIHVTDGYDGVTITAHSEFDTIGSIEEALP